MSEPAFAADWYADHQGKLWFCIPRERGMSCRAEDGSYTAAFFDTFAQWGWKLASHKEDSDAGK